MIVSNKYQKEGIERSSQLFWIKVLKNFILTFCPYLFVKVFYMMKIRLEYLVGGVHLYIFSQFNSQSGRPPASIESFPVGWDPIGRRGIVEAVLLGGSAVTILCDDCEETLHILYWEAASRT